MIDPQGDKHDGEKIPSSVDSQTIVKELVKATQEAEVILRPWILSICAEKRLWESPREEIDSFLRAADKVQFVIDILKSEFLTEDHPMPMAIELMKMSNSRMKEELTFLLENSSSPLHADNLRKASTSFVPQNKEAELFPFPSALKTALPSLKEITTRMSKFGCKEDVTSAFLQVRGGLVEKTMLEIGLKQFSMSQVQEASWEDIQSNIDAWLQCTAIAVRFVFPFEYRFLKEALPDPQIAEQCFVGVTAGSLNTLFSITACLEALNLTPEKIFKMVEIYEELRNFRIKFDTVFAGQMYDNQREKFANILQVLAGNIRHTYLEFENAIERDVSPIHGPIGGVHGLTNYVINYLVCLHFNKFALEEVFPPEPNTTETAMETQTDSDLEDVPKEESSTIATLTRWTLDVLCQNLEAKATQLSRSTEAHFFLMANFHYIARKLKSSDVREIVGDSWLRQRADLVRRHGNEYQKLTWNKILGLLSLKTANLSEPNRKSLKEKFKQCNSLLEEIHFTQSQWTLSEPYLREELHNAMIERVLEPYSKFYSLHARVLEAGRHPKKYIKYTPENLSDLIHDLFKGGPRGRAIK